MHKPIMAFLCLFCFVTAQNVTKTDTISATETRTPSNVMESAAADTSNAIFVQDNQCRYNYYKCPSCWTINRKERALCSACSKPYVRPERYYCKRHIVYGEIEINDEDGSRSGDRFIQRRNEPNQPNYSFIGFLQVAAGVTAAILTIYDANETKTFPYDDGNSRTQSLSVKNEWNRYHTINISLSSGLILSGISWIAMNSRQRVQNAKFVKSGTDEGSLWALRGVGGY